jgi:hypothetical protein
MGEPAGALLIVSLAFVALARGLVRRFRTFVARNVVFVREFRFLFFQAGHGRDQSGCDRRIHLVPHQMVGGFTPGSSGSAGGSRGPNSGSTGSRVGFGSAGSEPGTGASGSTGWVDMLLWMPGALRR